jgi:hypothetical protein
MGAHAEAKRARTLEHRARVGHRERAAVDVRIDVAREPGARDRGKPGARDRCGVAGAIAARFLGQRMERQVGGHHARQARVAARLGDRLELLALRGLVEAVAALRLDRRDA